MITPHGPIEAGELADDAVTTPKIAEKAVTAAKADIFLSEMITSVGTDASPEVHGLGATPSVFFAILQDAAATNQNLSATADATSVYVTAASASVKYIVFAWL